MLKVLVLQALDPDDRMELLLKDKIVFHEIFGDEKREIRGIFGIYGFWGSELTRSNFWNKFIVLFSYV
ncbi:hypothetical protein LEP1GSC040_3316 [Leptospira santarosai str. 2000030832]|nr:hypothetical protein LEP1GSC040_3316 [Leptospira santarosai str. 2000030832]